MAISGSAENYVTVLLGSSDAAFSSAINLPVDHSLGDLVAGDFDGDGSSDVALVASTRNQVSLIYGRGDGTFDLPDVTFDIDHRAGAIAASDFDHRRGLDAITAETGFDTFFELVNRGGRLGLVPAGAFFTGDRPQAITAADFNNDGFDDVAVLDTGSAIDDVGVYLGNGVGIFLIPVFFPVAAGARAFATADFDGDGVI